MAWNRAPWPPSIALAGKTVAIGRHRGPMELDGRPGIYPSFLLRMPPRDRKQAWKDFVADLRRIRKLTERRKAA